MARLSARVSDDAKRGWDRKAAEHGCTFTALIEALGLGFDGRTVGLPEELVEQARRIDRERFSRR